MIGRRCGHRRADPKRQGLLRELFTVEEIAGLCSRLKEAGIYPLAKTAARDQAPLRKFASPAGVARKVAI